MRETPEYHSVWRRRVRPAGAGGHMVPVARLRGPRSRAEHGSGGLPRHRQHRHHVRRRDHDRARAQPQPGRERTLRTRLERKNTPSASRRLKKRGSWLCPDRYRPHCSLRATAGVQPVGSQNDVPALALALDGDCLDLADHRPVLVRLDMLDASEADARCQCHPPVLWRLRPGAPYGGRSASQLPLRHP